MNVDKPGGELTKHESPGHITQQSDVQVLYRQYVARSTEQIKDVAEQPVTQKEFDDAYRRLRGRWAAMHEEFRAVFPASGPTNLAQASSLRGEVFFLAEELARFRAMVRRFDRDRKDGKLTRAKDYQLAFFEDILEAMPLLDEEKQRNWEQGQQEWEEVKRRAGARPGTRLSQAGKGCFSVLLLIVGSGAGILGVLITLYFR